MSRPKFVPTAHLVVEPEPKTMPKHKPTVLEPKPAVLEPKPAVLEHRPTVHRVVEPKPTVHLVVERLVVEPKPAVLEPKPGVLQPKPVGLQYLGPLLPTPKWQPSVPGPRPKHILQKMLAVPESNFLAMRRDPQAPQMLRHVNLGFTMHLNILILTNGV